MSEMKQIAASEASMNLPDGKTCNDCAHYSYCSKLIGDISGNTHCDWAPSRFVESSNSRIRSLESQLSAAREAFEATREVISRIAWSTFEQRDSKQSLMAKIAAALKGTHDTN